MSRSEARSAAHNGRTGFPVRPFLFPAGDDTANFRGVVEVDGGPGTDTLDYLTYGNTGTLFPVNFETIT